jgi:hypothetical protein
VTPPPNAAAGGCDCLPPPPRRESADTPAPPTPPAFVLRYEDRWFGIEKRVVFDAPDTATALALIEHEPIGRWAELSQEGVVICRRGGEPGDAADYWVAD